MRRLTASLLFASALGLGMPTAFAAPLVTPAELAAKLTNPAVRVIDIRDGKDEAGKTPYQVGHLPGALHAPYSQWRGPKDNPGALPDAAQLTTLVQRLGLTPDSQVIVVHEGSNATDFGAAARVYYTLKVAGFDQLSILNGGMKAWRAAGNPVSTDAAAAVAASSHVVKLDDRLVATRDEVAKSLKDGKTTLIDARPPAFFEGETRHVAAKTPGTIDGAKNISHAVWFDKDGTRLLSAEELRKIAQAQGITPTPEGSETVSFCNTGHWASTNWFVLHEMLGDERVSMYPDSMVDWSASGLPMSHVPGRLKQLLIDLKLATQ